MAHRAVLLVLLAATAFSASGFVPLVRVAVDGMLDKVFGAVNAVAPPGGSLPPIDAFVPIDLLPSLASSTEKPRSVARRSVEGYPQEAAHHLELLEPVEVLEPIQLLDEPVVLEVYDTVEVHEPVEVVEVVEPVVVVVDSASLVDHPLLVEEYDNYYYSVDHPNH